MGFHLIRVVREGAEEEGRVQHLLVLLQGEAGCVDVLCDAFVAHSTASTLVISTPQNFVHEVHVGFDPDTGEFSVCDDDSCFCCS